MYIVIRCNLQVKIISYSLHVRISKIELYVKLVLSTRETLLTLHGYDFKRKLPWSEECEKALFFVSIIAIITILNTVFFL